MKRRFVMWQSLGAEHIRGVKVEGDTEVSASPKNPILLLLYLLFVWKKVVVFEVVNMPMDGFRIGYCNFRGEKYMTRKFISHPRFAMLRGREDCRFFAVSTTGKELSLNIIECTTKNDKKFHNTFLY